MVNNKSIELKSKDNKNVEFYFLKTFDNGNVIPLYSHKWLTGQELKLRAYALGYITKEQQNNCVVVSVSYQQMMKELSPMSYIFPIGTESRMLGGILDEHFENYDAQKHWDFMRN